MKCELCKVREAGCVLHREKDGGVEELYVCKACQKKVKAEGTSRQVDAVEPEMPDAARVFGEEDGLEFLNGGPHELGCPVCGMTRTELRRGQRLGCSACYQAFAHEVALMIRDMHKGGGHVEEDEHGE